MESGAKRRSWLKRYWVLWFILAPFGVLFIVWLVALCLPVSLQPGPETTVISEPLRPDGKIDYAAALTATYSEGVTFENNAAVPLLQIFGARRFVEKVVWREYVRQLGLNEDFPKEYLLLDLDETFQGTKAELRDIQDQQSLATDGPWTREDFPEIAKWLDANANALAVARMAAKRERFFLPILSFTNREFYWDEGEIGEPFRVVARLLAAEGQLLAVDGRIEQALDNAEVIHKLARLLSRVPRVYVAQTSSAIQSLAARLDSQIVRSKLLSAELVKKQRLMLASLSPFPSSVAYLDRVERFHALDAVQNHLPSQWHVNAALKAANQVYDEAVRIEKTEKPSVRLEEILKLKKRFTKTFQLSLPSAVEFVVAPRYSIGRGGGLWLAAAMVVHTFVVDEQRAVRHTVADTGYAIAEYRLANGRYPQQLSDLVPDYVTSLPVDPFATAPDASLRYRVDAEGEQFLLYSISVNGVDDGGKRQPPFDDIASGEPF